MNTTAGDIGFGVIEAGGLNYEGMMSLGAGSIIVGIILGSIAAYIIDHKFFKCSNRCCIRWTPIIFWNYSCGDSRF